MKTLNVMALLACTLALAACGDSPDNAPDVGGQPAGNTGQVPASATVSTAAYVAYTGRLTASETDRPLGVNMVTPPTSETESPQAL